MSEENSIHTDLLGTETRYYQTKNFRTRVIEAGEGLPVILMHGGGGHAEAYSRNMTRLGTICRPMAPDFCWHGLSSKPAYRDGNWLAQFTDQILELLDEIGAEKAIFEGESLGGWIAYDMAINHPDRTHSVILNTTWGMALDPTKVHEGESDLAALRETSVNALLNPTKELLKKIRLANAAGGCH